MTKYDISPNIVADESAEAKMNRLLSCSAPSDLRATSPLKAHPRDGDGGGAAARQQCWKADYRL